MAYRSGQLVPSISENFVNGYFLDLQMIVCMADIGSGSGAPSVWKNHIVVG